MTTTVKSLVETKFLEATNTTQYTATNVTALIDKAVAVNNTVSTVVLKVYLVPSGGSAGSSNLLISRSILAGKSDLCPEVVGHALGNGDAIVAGCDTATAVTFRVSGREITS